MPTQHECTLVLYLPEHLQALLNGENHFCYLVSYRGERRSQCFNSTWTDYTRGILLHKWFIGIIKYTKSAETFGLSGAAIG